MSTVSLLARLHELDRKLHDVDEQKRRLDRGEAARQAQVEAEGERDRVDHELKETRSRQRTLELDSAANDAKIKELNGKLYGGRVSNPKELSGYQHELDQAAHKRDELDEATLLGMDRIEELTAELARQEQAVTEAAADAERIYEQAVTREQILEAKRAEHEDARAKLRPGIEADTLAEYDRLRAKGDAALAVVKHGACSGCRMDVADAILRKIRSHTLVPCANCGRFLVDETLLH